ncbi:MAG: response regulator [Candidatus Omnitrophica bacterium]|nr:response regulator [Candidatus Omnitrophota bacterium]
MVKKKTILLIDDEVDFTDALAFQIKAKRGYEVVTAYNGEEGLKKLETVKPDLIVLDINMPVMGGVAFYNKICNFEGKPKHPVLVLTARANLEQIFKDLDVVGFMTKPFDLDVLLKEIDIVMSQNDTDINIDVPKNPEKTKVVLFVEDDDEAFKKIAIEFLSHGYMVNAAKNGGMALDKITADLPDVILIKMKLTDVSGDIVAAKFKQIAKMSYIPMIIYTPEKDDMNHAIVNRLCEKYGFVNLVETDDPYELLKEANRVLY